LAECRDRRSGKIVAPSRLDNMTGRWNCERAYSKGRIRMNLAAEILNIPIVGLTISIAATWLFAWLYFKKAGDELKVESEKLRILSEHLLLVVTHPPGSYTVKMEDGKIVGMYANLSARL
jgi:hypothetical protein